MTLPTFQSLRFRRREQLRQDKATRHKEERASDGGGGVVVQDGQSTSDATASYQPGVDIKRATRARSIAIAIASFSFFISVIFLILTIIGNINTLPVIRDTYFFRLDLSSVFPQAFSSSNLVFVNSIARSLGLHDFYQVGLWSYCEGYLDEGITYCSPPENMYWFNPVAIILNELLAGATIALPSSVVTTLSLVKIASNVMFGFFMTGILLAFACIFVTPVAIYSRWWSFPLSVLTFVTALLLVTSSVIATVMFSIFKNVLTSQAGLNIGAQLGLQMMIFMWIGAGGSLVGFAIQLGMSCCCASRRDVKSGRRLGNEHAYGDVSPVPAEQEKTHEGWRRWVGRKKPLEGGL